MKKLTFAILSIFFLSCDEKLPKPTQEGKNTFGCKVDGKTWIPDGGTGFMPAKPIEGGFYGVDPTKNELFIYIRAYSKSGESVELYLDKSSVGTYILNENTGYRPNQLYPKSYALFNNNGTLYITSQKNTGKIVIDKSDFASGIISGSFEFTAGNSNKTIIISQGRFDINSKTLK